VKEKARALSLLEKDMLSAGLKKEKPAEPGENEPSLKTKVEFEKYNITKSLNKDLTRVDDVTH